jgi:hypothetical protein
VWRQREIANKKECLASSQCFQQLSLKAGQKIRGQSENSGLSREKLKKIEKEANGLGGGQLFRIHTRIAQGASGWK